MINVPFLPLMRPEGLSIILAAPVSQTDTGDPQPLMLPRFWAYTRELELIKKKNEYLNSIGDSF